MFPCLISKAATVDVISDGEGPNRDGAVQLVSCLLNLSYSLEFGIFDIEI